MKVILFLFGLIFIVVIVTAIPETPCAGGVYDDHPALVQECLHQLSVNNSYPEPHGTVEPYPAPNPVVTVIFVGTREPIPTEPPPPTEMPR